MGKRGPAPTPTAQLKLAGSWRAKTRKNEPKPKEGVPSCPTWVNPEGKREWKRVAAELNRIGMLTLIDRAKLAAYCNSWGDYVDAVLAVRAQGATFTTEKGYIAKNPMVTVMNEARAAVLKFGQEFGLSPSARARVGQGETPPDKPPNGKARFFGAG